jgi:hypothetical protein
MYSTGIPVAISNMDAGSGFKQGLKKLRDYTLLPLQPVLETEFNRHGNGSEGEVYHWWNQILTVFSRCADQG